MKKLMPYLLPVLIVATLVAIPGVVAALGLQDIPGIHQESARIPAVATASDVGEWVIFRAPFNCRVKGLSFVPDAAVTGQASHNFTLDVQNKGTAGTGTTSLVTTITYGSGTDAVAFDETAFTLSTTDATIRMSAGEVLTLKRTKTGNGLAAPALLAVVRYEPR